MTTDALRGSITPIPELKSSSSKIILTVNQVSSEGCGWDTMKVYCCLPAANIGKLLILREEMLLSSLLLTTNQLVHRVITIIYGC